MRKPPDSLDAWAAYQRGLWHVSRAKPDNNALAQKFFQQAMDLDPNFAGGYWGLALAQHQEARLFGTRDLTEAQITGERLARRAVALDGADAEARTYLSNILMQRGDYEGAAVEVERALEMSPNLAYAHSSLGSVLLFSGHPKEALSSIETAISLDPRHPALVIRLQQVAQAHYFSGNYEAAVAAATRAIQSFPDYPTPYRWLAAALGQVGRIEEAKDALAKAIAIAPDSFGLHVRQRVPWVRPEDHAHMVEGLRKAGWES
jgi:adenylate cyclase